MHIQLTQKKYDYTLCSDHSLMTSFVQFNQTKDMFITAGEQGQINLYKINQSKNIKRLGYACVFENEVIVCLAWGNIQNGGMVAVAGSKGGFVILRVDKINGLFQIVSSFNNEFVINALQWESRNSSLFFGTNDGKIGHFIPTNNQFIIQSMKNFQIKLPVYVCLGLLPSNFPVRIAGVGSKIIEIHGKIKSEQGKQSNQINYDAYLKLQCNNQTILGLLMQQQIGLYFCELIVLTNKKLRIFSCRQKVNQKKQIMAGFCVIKIIQELDIQQDEFDRMFWGWNQSEIVLYNSNILKKLVNEDQIKGIGSQPKVTSPVVFKRKINGVWVRTNQ